MQQSRVSTLETPGANVTIETLATLAAVFKVGLVVKFVPFSEMLQWENSFSQDSFKVLPLDKDKSFLSPSVRTTAGAEIPPPFFPSVSEGAGSMSIPEQQNTQIAERYSTSMGQRIFQLTH